MAFGMAGVPGVYASEVLIIILKKFRSELPRAFCTRHSTAGWQTLKPTATPQLWQEPNLVQTKKNNQLAFFNLFDYILFKG